MSSAVATIAPAPEPNRNDRTDRERTPRAERPRRARLLRRVAAARFCGVGASTWDRLSGAGLTPAPIRLGGSVGWSRRELALWIDHGCPPRAQWEPIWAAVLRRAA
jgi:predicted DNA-binding transcriptional regulator AlpA